MVYKNSKRGGAALLLRGGEVETTQPGSQETSLWENPVGWAGPCSSNQETPPCLLPHSHSRSRSHTRNNQLLGGRQEQDREATSGRTAAGFLSSTTPSSASPSHRAESFTHSTTDFFVSSANRSGQMRAPSNPGAHLRLFPASPPFSSRPCS